MNDAQLGGVYTARVTDTQDPANQGRVKVQLPWSDDGGTARESWARLATLMGGANRGTWFVPDIGDEVLVAFEAGQLGSPYVVGALWNAQAAPPEQMDTQNSLKTILSRTGLRITLDDTAGAVKLRLESPAGHRILLDDGDDSVTVQDSAGNSIKLTAGGVTITTVGTLTVNAGIATFSGVVQCETLVAGQVVAPGAGNVW